MEPVAHRGMAWAGSPACSAFKHPEAEAGGMQLLRVGDSCPTRDKRL